MIKNNLSMLYWRFTSSIVWKGWPIMTLNEVARNDIMDCETIALNRWIVKDYLEINVTGTNKQIKVLFLFSLNKKLILKNTNQCYSWRLFEGVSSHVAEIVVKARFRARLCMPHSAEVEGEPCRLRFARLVRRRFSEKNDVELPFFRGFRCLTRKAESDLLARKLNSAEAEIDMASGFLLSRNYTNNSVVLLRGFLLCLPSPVFF